MADDMPVQPDTPGPTQDLSVGPISNVSNSTIIIAGSDAHAGLRPAPAGSPCMAEALPPDFVPRPHEFESLLDALLGAGPGNPAPITVALRGPGGFGKTVLARAICWDARVREAFPDGVLWVTLGEQPGDLTGRMNDLVEALSGSRPGYTGVDAARARLAEELRARRCLLVIDDVWNAAQLAPFLHGGPHCAHLITTRNSDTLPPGARRTDVDAMHADEAAALLGAGLPAGLPADPPVGLPASEPGDLRALAARLGEWPLLLKLANGQLREQFALGQEWTGALAYVLAALAELGPAALDAQTALSREQAITLTLRASVNLLPAGEREHYRELAVFPEAIDIPLPALERLWHLKPVMVQRLCTRLANLSLLSSCQPTAIRLHGVVRSYLVYELADRLPGLHSKFLGAYAPARWVDLPADEPYLWQHLAYHLLQAGRRDELCVLLTASPDWMQRKFEACAGDSSYAADLDRAIGLFKDPLQAGELLALAQLHTARQVVRARVGVYTDMDLRALIWFGREAEALSHARLRGAAHERFAGLMAIYATLLDKDRPQPELLDEAGAQARGIADERRRAGALSVVALALARAGDARAAAVFDEAGALAHGIADEHARAEALLALALALARAGDARARAVLDEGGPIARAIADEQSVAEQLRALAGPSDAGTGVVPGEAQTAARATAREQTRAEALSAVAQALAQAGDARAAALFDAAGAAAREIADEHARAAALSAVAQALARAGRFGEARALAREIANEYWRAEALGALAQALAGAGRPGEPPAPAHPAEAQDRSAEELRALGQALDLAGHFAKAGAVARGIAGEYRRAQALRASAQALAQAGRFDEARATALEIDEEYRRAGALRAVAQALAEAGRFAAALDTFPFQSMDKAVWDLALWACSVQRVWPGLGARILEESIRIAAWAQPDWSEVYALLGTQAA